MNLKCPNCSEFKFNKVTTGKWTFGFWNLVVYFFGVTAMFGTKDHSTSDNYTTTHEELFGIPMLIWGFFGKGGSRKRRAHTRSRRNRRNTKKNRN